MAGAVIIIRVIITVTGISIEMVIIKRQLVSIKKLEAWVGFLTMGQGMNMINHIIRHGQWGGLPMVEDASSRKTAKAAAALIIAGRAEGKSTDCMRSHGVVCGFMCLDTFPIIKLTMLVAVDGLPSDDDSWAQGGRNAIRDRENIKPKCFALGKLNQQA